MKQKNFKAVIKTKLGRQEFTFYTRKQMENFIKKNILTIIEEKNVKCGLYQYHNKDILEINFL